MRESSCCSPAGSGVLIRWKGGLSCWWMHEEEADRGSRRAAEFTPCLEKAPSCSIPLSFSIPPSSLHPSLRSILLPSPFSPSRIRSCTHALLLRLFHLLRLVLFMFARLVNASRPERTLHTHLFTGRFRPRSLLQGEGLRRGGTPENSCSEGKPRYGAGSGFSFGAAPSSREIFHEVFFRGIRLSLARWLRARNAPAASRRPITLTLAVPSRWFGISRRTREPSV